MFNDPGRISDSKGIGRNALRHDASSSDNAFLTDSDSREKNRFFTDPGSFSDRDGRNRKVIVQIRSGVGLKPVILGDDRDVIGYRDIIFDDEIGSNYGFESGVDVNVISDAKRRNKPLLMIRGIAKEAGSIPNSCILSDRDMLGFPDVPMRPDIGRERNVRSSDPQTHQAEKTVDRDQEFSHFVFASPKSSATKS
jgi:hypothetical protein